MLKKFLQILSRTGNAASAPFLDDGIVCYAVGDIHGRSDLLDILHQRIVSDAARRDATQRWIVYLGDYIDRGPDSRGVVERLVSNSLKEFETKYLSGNHEATLLRSLREPGFIRNWRLFGADATLASYGVRVPSGRLGEPEYAMIARDLEEALPEKHKEFFRNLMPMWRLGRVLFAHAGVRPGLRIDKQIEEDLLTIREPFLSSGSDFGAFVVHGHSASYGVERRRNRLGIDTGAYATGILSCAVISGGELQVFNTVTNAD